MIDGFTYEGRCWVFGEDVPNDDGLMDRSFFRARITDPEKLSPHPLELVRSEFAQKAAQGDIILAGKGFATGNPHPQGAIALRARGIGLLAEGLSSSTYRLFVSFGVPFVVPTEGLRRLASDGDRVRVDFGTGRFSNLTTGGEDQLTALPAFLLETIAAGGTQGHLRQRLDAQRAAIEARA